MTTDIITDTIQNAKEAFLNSRLAGCAAGIINYAGTALFGGNPIEAEKQNAEEERFVKARESFAQAWKEN